MTTAPLPGKYIVGEKANDGHEHEFHVSEEFPRDDYPKATKHAFINETVGPHAHSIIVNDDGELVCVTTGGTYPHTHTNIRKVATNG